MKRISADWKKSSRSFANCRAAVSGGPANTYADRLVARVAEAEDRTEDERQDQHADGEADTLAEVLARARLHDDHDDEVDERDEQQDEPPERLAGDLEEHDQVVDRDDRRPTRLAGLRRRSSTSAMISRSERRSQQIIIPMPMPAPNGDTPVVVVVVLQQRECEQRVHMLFSFFFPGLWTIRTTVHRTQPSAQ